MRTCAQTDGRACFSRERDAYLCRPRCPLFPLPPACRVDGPALRDKKHRLGEVFVHPNGTRFTLERPVSIANLCAFLGDRCRDLADAELQSTLPGMVHSRVQANLLGGSSAERPSQVCRA